jgi:hypothetical protein
MYPIITALVYQIMVVVWKVVASRFWPYKFVATINGGQDKLNWAAIFGFAAGLSVVILIFHGITIGLIAIRNLMLPKEKKSTAAASQDTIVEVV